MTEIRKEVDLDATPEQVWEAIATAEGLATWFMPMPIDADSDMVTDFSPPKRLAIDMGVQAFEYVIEPRRGEHGPAATLRFVHNLGDDADEDMFSAGWDMYFHTLAQYFRHFAGRPATYYEAEAPQDAAWPRIVEAARRLDGEIDYATDNFLGVRSARSLIRFHGRWLVGLPVAVSEHVYDGAEPTEQWADWLAAASS